MNTFHFICSLHRKHFPNAGVNPLLKSFSFDRINFALLAYLCSTGKS